MDYLLDPLTCEITIHCSVTMHVMICLVVLCLSATVSGTGERIVPESYPELWRLSMNHEQDVEISWLEDRLLLSPRP